MKINCVKVTQFDHMEPMYAFEFSKFDETSVDANTRVLFEVSKAQVTKPLPWSV